MAGHAGRYTTKELSRHTWPDFERLFARGNGWDFCACMAFQHDRVSVPSELPRAERQPVHLAQKKALVEDGRAHGILVYAHGEPIGWCQFGRVDELVVGRRRKGNGTPTADNEDAVDWRITCFVTDKRHRRQGIAGIALRAALDAIRKQGGGIVEALPIVFCIPNAAEARTTTRTVPGTGAVAAAHGTFGNVSTQGTITMFEAVGFRPVGIFRRTHVVMRLRV